MAKFLQAQENRCKGLSSIPFFSNAPIGGHHSQVTPHRASNSPNPEPSENLKVPHSRLANDQLSIFQIHSLMVLTNQFWTM
jgi:hypothetical protein